MGHDIRHILEGWTYDKDRPARKIIGDDGKPKLQVRLPLGIEQYEIDGRPDGERPHGYTSLLEYHKSRLLAHQAEKGSDESFQMCHDDFLELTQEGMLYYYRYVLFFQVGDYVRTVRDTQRNVSLFDFCRAYAGEQADRDYLEQYRPYVIRMNRMARALLSTDAGRYKEAVAEIDAAIQQIERLEEMELSTFVFEKQRSLSILRHVRKELEGKRPKTLTEKLQAELAEAVRSEDYERAAHLRDELRGADSPQRNDGEG